MAKRMFKPERYYNYSGKVTVEQLKQAFEAGETVTVRVNDFDIVNNFLYVNLNDTVEGILPFEECCLERLKYFDDIPEQVEYLLRKKVIRVKIVTWTSKRIIVSRRTNLLEVIDKAQYIVGRRVYSTIEHTKIDGCYCDIGEGLIAYCYEAEVSKARIPDVTKWFKIGEVKKVLIEDVNLSNLRIRCSIKRADSCDYSKIIPRSYCNAKVATPIVQDGIVTGYYVELSPGITGIADVLTETSIKYPSIQLGDRVRVYIRKVCLNDSKPKVKMYLK